MDDERSDDDENNVDLTLTATATAATTTTTRIAFGSCHKSQKSALPPIWETILPTDTGTANNNNNDNENDNDSNCNNDNYANDDEYLDGWLWIGDAMYPTHRNPITNRKYYGPAPPQEIEKGLRDMKYNNSTIGYKDFLYRLQHQNKKLNQKNHNHIPPPIPPPPPPIVTGVWDDHDFGGNDMGSNMPHKKERQIIYRDFLHNNNIDNKRDDDSSSSSPKSTLLQNQQQKQQQHGSNINSIINSVHDNDRDGMYHRHDFENGKIRLLVLDTRWFREEHCIPSWAHQIPKGNALACITRWLTSGFLLHKYAYLWKNQGCEESQLLGEEQWRWLENELLSYSSSSILSTSTSTSTSTLEKEEKEKLQQQQQPELFVILSSIQVWTTNPIMESWGQFPKEKERLWNLLRTHYHNTDNTDTNHDYDTTTTPTTYTNKRQQHPHRPAPVLFLSGDVHHGEISGQHGYYEITSSGLTHHCGGSDTLYGRLCKPILETYTNHRYRNDSYYIGINYGTFEIRTTTNDQNNRNRRQVRAQIKNSTGYTVLEVIQPLNYGPIPKLPPFSDIPQTWDGHLIHKFATVFTPTPKTVGVGSCIVASILAILILKLS